ncbi:hypothetical protein A2482_03905 [Candidatus Falkowbacteria bacterium RIFOXYC2_FULL_48_21]|uniref:Uncharacterized protein n=1 Tax=Candidatus Falkowbacteria bacterium RIFOXYC2_FULL_48_21 TaxID=1798005 RepID=A0A1F5TCA3_9BACT|nr:MAG: hypothetical protein A2482_03905 [Candidatus Falkowbacteria bacterium RIFOXYC2_FULL_48_21]
MEILLIVGFGSVILAMVCMTMEIVKAIKSPERSPVVVDEGTTVLVLFHCVATSGGEIYQSEECVIKAGSDHLLLTKINDQKCELANKHHRPIIVHQIVKL